MNINGEKNRVEFEDTDFRNSIQESESNTPKIVRILINNSGGLIKDEKQATYLLYGFVIVSFILTISILKFNNNNKNIMTESQKIKLENIQQIENNIKK